MEEMSLKEYIDTFTGKSTEESNKRAAGRGASL